ncbi:hypothetical protein, partial [uncultured Nostoc sp.]|uniref:hypothetical protein n=1 Tax=uncultured Nostoc sp. TaxID=340711 RepID=UPI0035CBC646
SPQEGGRNQQVVLLDSEQPQQRQQPISPSAHQHNIITGQQENSITATQTHNSTATEQLNNTTAQRELRSLRSLPISFGVPKV